LVKSNRGYAIAFEYGSSGAVSAACGFNLSQSSVTTATTCGAATLKTSYSYASGGNGGYNLTAAVDVFGNAAQYTYSANIGGLVCLTDPGSTTCKVTNSYQTGQYHITQQTMGDGTIWQFSCSCSSDGKDDSDDSFPDDSSGWTDPNGNGMAFDYHGGVMTAYYDAFGRQYVTGSIGRYPTYVKLPESNSVAYAYSDRMAPAGLVYHAKSGSGMSDISTDTKTYPSSCANAVTCNKPLTSADANNNVSNLTYNATHGGVESEMGPAPGPNFARPLKLHTYVQKYAYILNSAGALAQAAGPVWLPATDTECQTVVGSNTASCDSGAQQIVTSYEYGADGTGDNLLVHGKAVTSGGVTLRTCYSYDWMGNKISETAPRAGRGSCQ
jgi:hypothetical protein